MHKFDWTIEESRYVVKDEWLSVRADTCRMPNGQIVTPYYVIEYPTWVNVVALTAKQDVILVKQYRHGIKKTVLELPGGAVMPTNETPLDAIQREFLEETGYMSDHFIETGRVCPNPACHTNYAHCFLARNARFEAKPEPDATEQIEVVLMPLDEVRGMVNRGELLQALHISSFFFAMRKLENEFGN